jgi:MFS family permease
MTLSPETYTWLCGAFVSLGSLTFGYDLGIIASVIVRPCLLRILVLRLTYVLCYVAGTRLFRTDGHPYGDPDWTYRITHAARSVHLQPLRRLSCWYVFPITYLHTTTLTPHSSITDSIGRRLSVLVGCMIFFLGGGLQTAAQSLHWIYAGRFVAGMGIGMLAMLAPLYQSEIAHPSIRGRLTSLQQFFLGVGARLPSRIEL